MPPIGPNREHERCWYAVATVMVIGLGLASRQPHDLFPAVIAQYPGDAFWALMIFCVVGLCFPHTKRLRRAGYALTFSYAIEVSQLYQAPWINGIRSSTLGHLILGQGFQWGDLFAYTLGISVGIFGERAARAMLRRRSRSQV